MNSFDIAKTETRKLKNSRCGKDYYRILNNISVNVKDDFITDVTSVRSLNKDRRITIFHIGCLMIRYELNCAATIHLLEKFCGAPSGTYGVLKDRGLNIGKMIEEVMNSHHRFDVPFEIASRYN